MLFLHADQSAALETFGRSVAGPLSGYLFDVVGARGVPLTCSCAATYVAVVLSVRGLVAHDPALLGVEGGGGARGRDVSHKRGSKIDTKRK